MTTLTYYGHACFGLTYKGSNILFDPFISGNEAAGHINIDSIPADYILLSHGHQDHVLDVEAIAKRTGAAVISNFEVANWFGAQGIENVRPMNHGGEMSLPFGKIKYVNAVHTSSMPDGSYGGQPGGWVVFLDNGPSFYYSGDTALTYDMKLIGEQWAMDFAILCLGDHFTMGLHDAVRAAEFVGAHKVIGMHFDTFPPIEIDHDEAQQIFREAGLDLTLPKIGEMIEESAFQKAA